MIRRADIALVILFLFVVMFATCARAQTVSLSQLVMRCASGSRLSGASETILYKRCSDGKLLYSQSAGAFTEFGAGVGTVTSVGISGPAGMSVTGSPVTTSGVISLAWQSQAANLFFASPDGSSGAPTFRVITEADVPASFMTTTEVAAAYLPLTGGTTTGNITVPSIITSSHAGFGTSSPVTNSLGNSYAGGRVVNLLAPGATIGYYVLDGGAAAIFDMIDNNGTTNFRRVQLLFDGGNVILRSLTDAGSLRNTGWTWNSTTNNVAFTNISVSGTCTGCSGTGDQNAVGAWASRPAGGVNAGNTYQPTDAPMMQIDDGSALAYFGPRYRFYLPVLGDFTAVNLGTATADQTNGAVWVQGPGTGTATLRAWVKTAPATPYTITIAFQPQLIADVQYAGFTWRDSATDKMVTCYLAQQTGFAGFYAANWTTSSSFSADVASATEPDSVYNTNRADVNWIRATDNGTDRTCSWSVDGVHFFQWYTAGRTTHMTANQVGFTIGGNNASNTVQMNLYSWLQQ